MSEALRKCKTITPGRGIALRTMSRQPICADLAAKIRSFGCVVHAPNTQLHYAMQKLLSEGS